MGRFLCLITLLAFASVPSTAGAFLRQFPIERDTTLMPGTYTFSFRLYATPSGGIPLFTEKKSIRLTGRRLRHVLGSVNRAGMQNLDLSRQWYLEVVRAGSLVPVIKREPFFVAPYSVWSEKSAGLAPLSVTEGMIAPGAVTDRKIGGIIGESKLDPALVRDNDVLPLVLAGDGPGSGLDADLLDGQHASEIVGTPLPIGAVIDWWRPNASWPVPQGFAICDGGTVSDAASPLNGVTLPNLSATFVMGVVNPAAIGSSGGGQSHTHSTDVGHDHAAATSVSGGAVSGGTSGAGTHGHAWAWQYNADWQSWRADGSAELMVLWTDGFGNEGSGHYAPASTSTNSGVWYTEQGGGHSHTFSQGGHTHGVDIPDTGALSRQSSVSGSLPPYIGLLKLMRIK